MVNFFCLHWRSVVGTGCFILKSDVMLYAVHVSDFLPSSVCGFHHKIDSAEQRCSSENICMHKSMYYVLEYCTNVVTSPAHVFIVFA